MLNDYVFENRKYENAVRDLKATLFDIIAMEEIKLSNIEMKIGNEFDSAKREELEKLCALQDDCLKRTLRVTNELTESLIKLDSYSKNLKKFGSENVSEAIADVGNDIVYQTYENDLENAINERDNLASGMVNSFDELDVSDEEKEQMIQNVQTIQTGEGMEDYDSSEEVADEEEDYQDEAAPDTEMAEEVEDTEVPVDSDEVEAAENGLEDEQVAEVALPTVEAPSEENTADIAGLGDEQVAEVALPEVEVPSEENTADIAGLGDEQVAEVALPTVEVPSEENTADIAGLGDEQVAEVALPEVEASSEENIAETTDVETEQTVDTDINLPVIDAVKEAEGTVTLTPTQAQNDTVNVALNSLADTVANQEQLANENKALVKEELGMGVIQKIKFIKSSSEVSRAILTTKKQITKLRESKETQKALLSIRNMISNNPIAEQTVAVVDSSLDDEKVTEQQLIASGLLEASFADKQKQIETMLEQANNLYKEGKAAEAQVMYDQISALNKELQEANKGVSK